jgi:DNA-binding transcriptional MerR regulator
VNSVNERIGNARAKGADITVGEFSRLTHLPIKTLHHYHDVGVLVPALVDPVTGYRRYAAEQVPMAHLARRLREVRMPLDEVRAVLAAPDPSTRSAGIVAYLDRLQRELSQTATAVASLRNMLTDGQTGGAVRHRELAAQPALALFADVQRESIGPWCAQAYPRLMQSLGRLPAGPAGPGGALYGPGWFEDGGGRVTAFLPIDAAEPGPPTRGMPDRVHLTTIPAARMAVVTHTGGFDDLDLSYGVLGRHVLGRGIGAEGPIREYYLVSPADTDDENALCTEVCWPISATP